MEGLDQLNRAVMGGKVEEVKRLLDHQLNLNKVSRSFNSKGGVSPLMVASQIRDAGKREKMIDLLLERGADVNLQDTNGWTALMKAVRDKHVEIVEFLLTKQPDLEIRNGDSATALTIACSLGNLKIVELLLDKGAKVNYAENIGRRYDQDFDYYFKKSPLVIAVSSGHYEIVELLLSRGAQICIDSCDALVSACEKKDVDMVKTLLKNETVKVDSMNTGSTPLIAACGTNSTPIVEALLESNAKAGLQNKNGETALIFAVRNRNMEIIQLLLPRCTQDEVNLKNSEGNTALMAAVRQARTQEDVFIVDMLLKKNANPDLKNGNGDTGLTIALSKLDNDHTMPLYMKDMVKSLLNKSEEISYDKEIRFPISDETFEICKLLIEKGVDFGRLFYSGRETSLRVLSCAQQAELVKIYLDKNESSDINESDYQGCTPLWFAVDYKNYEIFELLWMHGANPQLCPFDGIPALEMLMEDKSLLTEFLQCSLKGKNYKMAEFLLMNRPSAEKEYLQADPLPELDTIDLEKFPKLFTFVSQQRDLKHSSETEGSIGGTELATEQGSDGATESSSQDSEVPVTVAQYSGKKRMISSDTDLTKPASKRSREDDTPFSVETTQNADANVVHLDEVQSKEAKKIEKPSISSTAAVRKKFSIVLQGIEECKQGTPIHERQREDLKKVTDILSKVDKPKQSEFIKDHRRLGAYTHNRPRPRPILVEFLRSSDVSSILSKRSLVKPPYSIQNYMSPEEQSRNAVLLKKRWSIHTETGINLEQIKIRKHSIYVAGKLHGTLNIATNEYELHPFS